MKLNIQNYHDYLEFLKAWTEYLKEQKKDFSLRKVAKEAGIASGYLSMCFNRKRKMSKTVYDKIKPLLHLSNKEIRILDLLRVISESEIPKERVDALSDLQKLSDYKASHNSELEVHQYLSHWYYVAIRELVNLPDFKIDSAWIQSRLFGRISQKEVLQGTQFLLNYGFILKTPSGKFEVAKKQLSCHEGVYKISLGEFHRQMLDIAKKSIDDTSRDERLLLGHTVALSVVQYDKIQNILREAIEKIESLDTTSGSESEVYQIQVAAFPLTKKPAPGNDQAGD